jgi:hypothetical protein
MCELERRSKSVTRSLLEAMEGKEMEVKRRRGEKGADSVASFFFLPSFLHSVIRTLDFATKVSG